MLKKQIFNPNILEKSQANITRQSRSFESFANLLTNKFLAFKKLLVLFALLTGVNTTFAVCTYSITSSAGSNGSISPVGTKSVTCGNNKTYTITPVSSCYRIASVTVDGFSVTPVAVYTFTNVSSNHTISATFVLITYSINASAGINGSISSAGNTNVNCGTNKSYTITPAACYMVQNVIVDGTSVGAVSVYTFTTVSAIHTISATFSISNISYTITASAGTGGSISDVGTTTVTCGSNKVYTITPDYCYKISSVTVNGASVGAVTSYTIANAIGNKTITATFAYKTLTITATAGANGTISPLGKTGLNCDNSQVYTITPAACYKVSNVTLNGTSLGAVSSYTIANATTNYTIAATFAIRTYSINASAGANGSITSAGNTNVNCGSNKSYTITPAACYSIEDVLVDGISVGAVATYSFSAVQADHTISATFVINSKSIYASAGPNGSISDAGTTEVNCGSSKVYTITPDACYRISGITLNGVSKGTVSTYTVANVVTNQTITATFAIKTYTITSSAGANGGISPLGKTSVNCGNSQEYTITPAACYRISNVIVDGASVGPVANYTFENMVANHTITATFAIITYSINASAGTNGSITSAGNTNVNCGSNKSYTITPAACYSIEDVLVDGISVGAVATYSFSAVQADHTISATFVINSKSIYASAGPNGSISDAGNTEINCGSSKAYTITPDACYRISGITLNGVSKGTVSTYTVANVVTNQTITATFAIKTYTITSSAGANGGISPLGKTSVNCGNSQEYTITPAACYRISNVIVDGASVGPVANYTFENMVANHTITATFAIITYSINASAGTNGSITSAGNTNVNCGSNKSYTITPAACYSIEDVLVDGISVGAVATYSFSAVQADHTISATFVINSKSIYASAGPNGSISDAGTTEVNCGSSKVYTITPASSCYRILDVILNGVSKGAVATYTVANVVTNQTITATFAIKTYTITSSAGANGGISPLGKTSVNCGNSQEYTITPAACYRISNVIVDGASVGPVANYTFENVVANHTITATFAIITYSINASAGTNGSITSAGNTNVNCGSNKSYTITPAACYSIEDVLVDGISVGAVATYSFSAVQADHTISATFVINSKSIYASAGPNGSISDAGTTEVNCGSSKVYTITPASSCYRILDVTLNGVSKGAVATYTVANVVTNQTITATFAIKTYTITSSAGANGGISPLGKTSVNCGNSQEYTITPAACYRISNVIVDGASVGPVANYTFENMVANHTITATFAIITYSINASAGTNGSITSAGNTNVNCGSNKSYTITPSANYIIEDVFVDGSSVGAVSTYSFSAVQDNHTISATFIIDTYSITASAGANGTISDEGVTTVNAGSNKVYTITPDDCYRILNVTLNGVSKGAVSSYTITNIVTNQTITATFIIKTYTITSSAGANGSISPLGKTAVNCDSSQEYTITPASCYQISNVIVDGTSVGAVSNYTFNNVVANHTISATFAIITYSINASAGTNGSITSAGSTNVNCGSNKSYTLTPSACYRVEDVLVDGISVGAVATYSFSAVQADHTISATFVLKTYSITATTDGNGEISFEGVSAVTCGSSQVYTITPASSCYRILNVTLNGVSKGAVSTYTVANVVTNQTITATFAIKTYTITSSAGANGSISPLGKTRINCEDDQVYTITPDSCYEISNVTVDGVSMGPISEYSFEGVVTNHTITATFASLRYTITASTGDNGTISSVGTTTLNCGNSKVYTFTPASCYQIEEVVIDDNSIGAVSSYTFSNVEENHSISVSFVMTDYIISSTAGTGGSISDIGDVPLACGDSWVFTITAEEPCYHIADVIVDGLSVGAVSSYTFTNVQANHTIYASFEANDHGIVISPTENGIIAFSGSTSEDCESNWVYNIIPDVCYHILDVVVDDESQGPLDEYTFSEGNHSISATFERNSYVITASAGANGSISDPGTTTIDCNDSKVYTITPATFYHVKDVKINGISVGAVLSYTFTNVQKNWTIVASFGPNTYSIVTSTDGNGSISPIGTVTVTYTGNKTFTITPSSCYNILNVIVDSSSVGAVSVYTFTNVASNHTIYASFIIKTYSLTALAGNNGSVSSSGITGVNCGSTFTYSVYPDPCYRSNVIVDGVAKGALSGYVFPNVVANHTISVTFELKTYTITASAGANGTISPLGKTMLTCGVNDVEGQVYTITPNACYRISNVIVNGVSKGAVSSYTIANVNANYTISATFAPLTYTITSSAGAHGTISPLGAKSVNCGGNKTYTITPTGCYSIGAVIVDGASVGAVSVYTFENVQSNHSISVIFSADGCKTSGLQEDEEANFSFHVYPNPSADGNNINVNVNSLLSEERRQGTISVYDIYGKSIYSNNIVYHADNHVYKINTETNMAAGIYFVTLRIGEKIYKQKLSVLYH